MVPLISIESIIHRQFQRWENERCTDRTGRDENAYLPLTITISRQTGSRGSYFGSRLAQKLHYQRLKGEVIETICRSPEYFNRLIDLAGSTVRVAIDKTEAAPNISQPSGSREKFEQLTQVVISVAQLGGVVMMGRGASWILGREQGFRIRIVCPLEKRIENLMKYKEYIRDDAQRIITHSDRRRSEFARSMFGVDIDDPLQYDLVINSANIDVEEMVDTALVAIEGKIDKLRYRHHDEI